MANGQQRFVLRRWLCLVDISTSVQAATRCSAQILNIVMFAFLLSVATRIAASDLWVVRGYAETPLDICAHVRWVVDPQVYNLTTQDLPIRIVHVSNGNGIENVVATVAAATDRSLRALGAYGLGPLWVTHIDVPNGVAVEGRMELFRTSCTLFPADPLPFAKVRTPVFTQLVRAGEQQLHLGTDLGHQHARVNVAIYNAAATPATAIITAHVGNCTATTPPPFSVSLAADTITQFPLGEVTCAGAVAWPSYVTVTVDQQSLSFVSTISNDAPPSTAVAIAP